MIRIALSAALSLALLPSIVAWSPTLHAQPAEPAEAAEAADDAAAAEADPLADIPTERLLAEAESAATLFLDLRAERAPLLDQARQLEAGLARLAVERRATALPDRPAMDEPPTDLAAAQALMDAWTRREEAAEAITALLDEREARLSEYRTLTLRLAHETELLADAAEALMPMLESVDRRRIDGEIDAAVVEEVYGDVPAETDPAELRADADHWQRVGRRAELEIELGREDRAAVVAETEGDDAEIARAQLWLEESTTRANLRASLQDQPLGQLIAAFSSRVADFESLYSDLSGQLSQSNARMRAVDRAAAALEGLVPPEAAAAEEGAAAAGLLATLDQAQRAVALAESVAEYRRARLDALESVEGALTEAAEVVASVRDQMPLAIEQAMSLDVLAELLQERAEAEGSRLPEEASGRRYAERLERLREARADLANIETDLAGRLDALDEEFVAARSDLVASRLALAGHRRALQREQEWTVFVEELQTLDGPVLIAAFEEADAEFQALSGDLAAIAREADRIEERVAEAEAALAALVDPAQLAVRDQEAAFEEWLAGRGLRIEAAPAEDAAPAEEAADTAEPTRAEVWLAEFRELRDARVLRRETFYRESADLREALQTRLVEAQAALSEQAGQTQRVLDSARRAWGAATILQARVRREEVSGDDLPARVEAWRSRENLEAASELAARIAQKAAAIEVRLAELEGLASLDALIPPLEAWGTTLNTTTERLGDYIGLSAQYGAMADLENLDPLDRQLMEAEIRDRIAADLGVYDVLDDFFASDETATLDELLRRFYERLVINERRAENLEDRRALLEQLVTLAQEDRPTLETLREGIAAALAVYERRLDIESTLVRAALDRTNAPDLLAELNERAVTELTLDDVPTLPRDGDPEALRQARNDLIAGLNGEWALVQGYRLWLQRIDGRIRPLGGIDQQVEAYQNESARLAATGHDIGRTVGRLVGFAPQELQTLLTGDTTLGPEDRRLLAQGEIGTLREQREGIIDSTAVVSLVSLVVIPVFAIVLIVLARTVGRRMVRKVERARAEEDGAKQRAQTLNGIFQMIFAFVVAALALIYMLMTVNIDVAPLVASLGIFGLAVAFGAQSTMKDVFAGFFILLERQLNVGDWVIVNGIGAQVESIGLRMTTLRDYKDGTLHYVANGNINEVANWNRDTRPAGLGGRVVVEIFTNMDADPEKTLAIMGETLQSMVNNPDEDATIYNTKIFPGICAIHPDSRTLEFRAIMDGDGYIWAFSRRYRNKVVVALREGGIPMPMARMNVTHLPPIRTIPFEPESGKPEPRVVGPSA